MIKKVVEFYEYGYSSKTQDGKHILMFDIDNIYSHDILIKSIKQLQKKYCLSDFYVFKTRGGYHLVCLDKLNFFSVIEIKKFFKYDDRLYNKISIIRGLWILRLGNDIKLVDIIHSKGIHEKSNSHRVLFNTYFNMGILEKEQFDIFMSVCIEKYLKIKDKNEYEVLKHNKQIDNF